MVARAGIEPALTVISGLRAYETGEINQLLHLAILADMRTRTSATSKTLSRAAPSMTISILCLLVATIGFEPILSNGIHLMRVLGQPIAQCRELNDFNK